MAEKTEEWTAVQRILPILLGAVFAILGLFIAALNLVEFQRVEYYVWSAVLFLFGLFVLILRFVVIPKVRVFK